MKNVALVLSGGGALGAAHIGVVQELWAKGLRCDFIAGVSAGSIVGGLLACGHDPAGIEKLLGDAKIFKVLFDFSSFRPGLIKGEKIVGLLKDLLGQKTFDELPYALYIGATDFISGEFVLINSGRLVDAVRASISVPVVFEPYYHPLLKRWLVDGGIVENLPVNIAVTNYKGSKIIAVDVATGLRTDLDLGSNSALKKPRLMFDAAMQTIRIMLKNQQRIAVSDSRVVYIRPDVAEFSSINIFKLSDLIQRGREAAAQAPLE
jgi:NTE family protein